MSAEPSASTRFYATPKLLATAPNPRWSRDITKLNGPAEWSYFNLQVVLEVFSRYLVGWMLARRESAVRAQRLITTSCERERILPNQLTIHADRGSAMTSKSVAPRLADLGVTKTHARPHVSPDNPFSEAPFKTLRQRPDLSERFGSLEDARGLRELPRMAEHRAQAQRDRARDAPRNAPRSRRASACRACPSPAGSLRRHARTLSPAGTRPARAAYGRVDQPTQAPRRAWRVRGRSLVNSADKVPQSR